MADRTVRVTLVAQAQGYIQGMQNASKATSELGSEAQKLAQKKEAFQQLGSAMLVVGGAITAVGVAALRTGIQYNTLQQTTRAALTTLLGSAEAANAQMDKLDDFARNSPFAKQTFIQAQRQMLAFGVETQKVIPYLDAVQNAVAAAGGSNADIEAIAATMSKVQSAAKITGQDLIEFGNRGINAAELIGSQMGMTGAQIREAITAGSLDATAALDALAAGMSERFAGAAENVKNTFEGSMDRIKAAWRDFSSALATPLVDPNGGGALIDLFNWTADIMRAFLALPEPVKNVITTVGLATGAFLLLGGTALVAVPKIAAMKASLAAVGITAGTVGRNVGVFAAAMGAAAGAVGFVVLLDKIATGGQKAALGLQATTEALLNSDLNTLTGDVGGFQSALDKLLSDDLNHRLNRFTSGLNEGIFGGVLPDPTRDATMRIEGMGAALADLVGRGNADIAAQRFAELAETASLFGYSTEDLMSLMPEYSEALKRVTNDTKLAESATKDNTAQLEALTGAAQVAGMEVSDLADKVRGFASVTLTAREAQRAFEEAVDSLTESVEANGATLDVTTEAGRANEAAIDALARKTLEHAAATLEQTGSQDEATAALQRGRDELINQLAQFGITGQAAEDYADMLGLIPSNIQTVLELLTGSANRAAEAFMAQWQGKRVTMSMFLDTTGGDRSAAAAAARYTGQAQRYLGNVPARSGGGDLDSAPGPIGRDSKLFWGAKGEHVLAASEVARMGGQSAVYAFRRQLMTGRTTAPATRMVGPSPSVMATTMRTDTMIPQVSLAGAQIALDVDGRQLRAVIREQVVAVDQEWQQEVRSGRRR